MTTVVLVGMSIHEASRRDDLQDLADQSKASLAFLQHGSPSLASELDQIEADDIGRVLLVGVSLAQAPDRSWLRRVAGHWLRSGTARPTVAIASRILNVLGFKESSTCPHWRRSSPARPATSPAERPGSARLHGTPFPVTATTYSSAADHAVRVAAPTGRPQRSTRRCLTPDSATTMSSSPRPAVCSPAATDPSSSCSPVTPGSPMSMSMPTPRDASFAIT